MSAIYLPNFRSSRMARCGHRAFTLIEMVIAVAIIAMMTLSLYQFVESNLNAIRYSTEISNERQAMLGLVSFIETQLSELPAKGQRRLLGQPHKFNNLASDEMTWVCRPGIGLLTSSAPTGQYQVTLELKPVSKTSTELELGLRRRPVDGEQKDETWYPLMRPVAALEIRYFQRQLNAWVERWNDQATLPSVVRITITRDKDEPPHEAVLALSPATKQ